MSAERLTEHAFYAAAGEDSPYEYLGGAMVIREPASDLHEDLFAFLLVLLRLFLEERGLGVVRGSRFPMRLDASWSPEPDLLVVLQERRHLLRPQRLEGAADLVIEIASASSARADLGGKLPRYREARVPEIWLIDPSTRTLRVDVLAPAESTGYRSATLARGRLASAILPGFWIDVAWLWREPLPATLSCLRQILG
jgi:Uma2 family endonuclease